ncbi:MAG TPA: cytochrome c maturation protein CcmE [Xanthomonadales bacterium]|nr:cytochrome c maturation protein CcmE [Xanthomonadales bacterium]
MNPTRKRRLWLIALVLVGVGGATALALAALRENVQHFYSPSDVIAGQAPDGRNFRIGGLVQEESVHRARDSLQVDFLVTDRFKTVPVRYTGILPDLFKEGQSVVATGKLDNGTFVASEVLAKHDENYMPREVADAIARAKAQKGKGED